MRSPVKFDPADMPDPSKIKPRPPRRRKATSPTRCQLLAAASMLFSQYGNGRQRPTQAELASLFGVSQQAISERLKRFESLLAEDQRARYLQCLGRGGRKHRFTPVQLSLINGV